MLNIIDTENQHGSEQIKRTVKKILQEFDIDETQVLSICVDNANNMVRAVRTFSESPYEEDDQEDDVLTHEESNSAEQWVTDPKLILPEWLLECNAEVQVMRCAVHTLQLAVWAGLNNKEAEIHLKKIRMAVIKLRTPQVRTILLKRFHLTQSIDTVTRWGSTYLMIKRFLKFKSFCEEAAATGTTELSFTTSEWENIELISELLAKAYAATIHLQSADLTPGVFLKEWCRLKKYLSDQPGIIASEILSSMIKREDKMFLNTHFLAGVYVDPRYRILLTKEQQSLAKSGLFDIVARLHKILLIDSVTENDESNTSISLDSISSTDDEFEKLLDFQEKRKRFHNIQLSNIELFKKNFDDQCELIEQIGRIKVNNVFDAIIKYPEKIQHACKIASCIPTTQVSVERLFSSVKIILSDLRNSIKEDLLSAILFYRNH